MPISLYFQTETAKIFYYRTGNKCRILNMRYNSETIASLTKNH